MIWHFLVTSFSLSYMETRLEHLFYFSKCEAPFHLYLKNQVGQTGFLVYFELDFKLKFAG